MQWVKKLSLNTKVLNLEKKSWYCYFNSLESIQHRKIKFGVKNGVVIKKNLNVSGLVTTAVLNTKMSEVEGKIPDASSLVTITVLNMYIGEVEIKIPYVSGLVKKINCDTKKSDIEKKKYCTTSDYNKFMNDIADAKIKENVLVDKSNISNLVKNSDLNTKLATLIFLKTEICFW